MKNKKVPVCGDWRGCLVHVNDTVLVREPFPRTTVLKIGQVEKIESVSNGAWRIKLVKGKWYNHFLKLANK